ncbi:MAG TPA: class I SAM-dependent methyltransferase [Polyangiaceae bacterium]|nr:class I SAM-dependent methyltransferase [Polyangiaceae bacterium]
MTSPALPFGLTGRDEASAYFDWIVGLFGDALAGNVLDHGAGTGAITARLAARANRVIALEPGPELCAALQRRFAGMANVVPLRGTIETYLAEYGAGSLDAIVSSNVLEHLADDLACLQQLRLALSPGGALAVYVPARQELFGSLDRAVGHQRRYSRKLLRDRLEQAGFFVQWVRYGNLAGVLPWLVSGRVLARPAISAKQLGFYDRFLFPVSARIEQRLRVPYGLNVAALARRQ